MRTGAGRSSPPLLAAVCIARCFQRLGLAREQQAQLTAFGWGYLSAYLERKAVTVSTPAVLERRLQQLDTALGDTGAVRQIAPAKPGTRVHFPQSVWMQLHWFTSSLGVSLSQEYAVAEMLDHWVANSPTREPSGRTIRPR